jgi:hypothetical protein
MGDSTFDFDDLPIVPEKDRPRRLFVAQTLSSDASEGARTRGWEVVDVRILSSSSMEERRNAVLAYLEGSRCGSLDLSRSQLDALELEAKACGILGTKGLDEKPKEEVDEEDLLSLLPKASTRIKTRLSTKKGVKDTDG